MKITKQQLKQIIKEEIIKEARDPVGPGPSAGELMGRARENFPPDVLAQAGYGEEEEMGSIAGQDVPNEKKYPAIVAAFKEILDLNLGENYNLYKVLQDIAEWGARGSR